MSTIRNLSILGGVLTVGYFMLRKDVRDLAGATADVPAFIRDVFRNVDQFFFPTAAGNLSDVERQIRGLVDEGVIPAVPAAAIMYVAYVNNDDVWVRLGQAYQESSFIPTAVGDRNNPPEYGGPAYGLFQLQEGTAADRGWKPDQGSLLDPWINALYAGLHNKWVWNNYTGKYPLSHLPFQVLSQDRIFGEFPELPRTERSYRGMHSLILHQAGSGNWMRGNIHTRYLREVLPDVFRIKNQAAAIDARNNSRG